jgi:hypothetical protein
MDWVMKMQSEQNNKKLDEAIQSNDLKALIDPVISIDQYKSKVADDDKAVVVAVKINGIYPAQDLSHFLETGFPEAMDVDISPGPNDKGLYTVFIEFKRDSKLFSNLDRMLEDIKQVDNEINEWTFISYENKSPQLWSAEAFNTSVVSDSYEYVKRHNKDAAAISERIKFLNKY